MVNSIFNYEKYKCSLHHTCHCNYENYNIKSCEECKKLIRNDNCLNICKNTEGYCGDKIIKEINNRASFDFIKLKNDKYILIEFKNIKSNDDSEIINNIEKAYFNTKEVFDFTENDVELIILVFGNVLSNYNNINRYNMRARNIMNKNEPLTKRKIPLGRGKFLCMLCKSNVDNLSFEKYLQRISI